MKGFLVAFALCILGTYAIPKPAKQHAPIRGRVGNGEVAESAPHACMVLVIRPELEGTSTAALGGGSIISTRRVLTAAHLVRGTGNRFQVGFITTTGARRRFDSTFAIAHEDYDPADFSNDIALIYLQGTNVFPLVSVIPFATDVAAPAAGDAATLVGFGFTSATSTGASADPYAAVQAVAVETACVFDNFEVAATHFCAIDEASPAPGTVVCPGDNGAGLYTELVVDEKLLVGVASRILPGCAEAQLTAYTRVATFEHWITNLLT